LRNGQAPQRRDLGRARGVQHVAGVLGLAVARACVLAAENAQSGCGDPAQQLIARAQAQVLRQV